MKKITSIILCAIILCTSVSALSGCGGSGRAVAEWGFENFGDYDCTILKIQEYDLDEGYVVVRDRTVRGFKFEDNQVSNVTVEIDEDLSSISEVTEGDYMWSYEVVDNDTMNLDDGWAKTIIKSREDNENAVVFDISSNNSNSGSTISGNYIPVTFIDFEQPAEETTYTWGMNPNFQHESTGYKLFLKTSS